jgi:hypothetical protein
MSVPGSGRLPLGEIWEGDNDRKYSLMMHVATDMQWRLEKLRELEEQ